MEPRKTSIVSAQGGFGPPDPRIVRARELATSEMTRENANVTYVLAFANFYCDEGDSNPLDPRIVRAREWLLAKSRARTLASRMCLPLLIFIVTQGFRPLRPTHCAVVQK